MRPAGEGLVCNCSSTRC